MEFKDSQTYQNLLNAYELELMSSSELDIFAITAQTEEYIHIRNMFQSMADNDLQHARIWLRKLNNNSYPSTVDNLNTARQDNISQTYRDYSAIAIQEGYEDIASLFSGVANIELNHDLLLSNQLRDIESNQVFCKNESILWVCLACGNIMGGYCAPEICPVCSFPQGYYTPLISEDF